MPLGATTFYLQLGAKIMIMAIFALSLDLLIGHTGLVSFGHSAYFGVAAYALALITPKYEAANFWLTLPAAMAAAAFAALVIGALVVRTAGIYFIMVTLAFAQMLYAIFHDTKLGGGSDGIYINVRPELNVAGFKPLDLESPAQFFYLALIALIAVYWTLNKVLHAPFGRALAGIRVNEQRMRAIGFPVFCLQARRLHPRRRPCRSRRLSRRLPVRLRQSGNLGWHHSGTVLMMVILGGMGRLHGAVHRRGGVCLIAGIIFLVGAVRRLCQALATVHGRLDRLHRTRATARHRRTRRYCLGRLAPPQRRLECGERR